MIREDQRVSEHDILPAAGRKHDDLSDVVWGEWLDALVHSVCLCLVAIEADDREFLIRHKQ